MITNYLLLLIIILLILFIFKNKKEYTGYKKYNKEKIELHKSSQKDNLENKEVFKLQKA